MAVHREEGRFVVRIELSAEFGVSRERVRQIEVRAFEKVQAAVKAGVARAQIPHQAPAALPAA